MPRYRADGALTSTTYRYYQTLENLDGSNSNYYRDLSSVAVSNGTQKCMEDEVIPRFYLRSRQLGEIFNNPMKRCVLDQHITPFCVNYQGLYMSSPYNLITSYASKNVGVPVHTETMGNVLWYRQPLYGTVFNSADQGIAVNRAWGSLELSQAQLLSTLGELEETVNFLVTLLKNGAKLVRDFCTGRWAHIIKDAKGLFNLPKSSDVWLELRYALRPLVFEVYATMQAIQAKLVNTRITSRGTYANRSVTTSTERIGEVYYSWWYWYVDINWIVEDSYYYRAGVLARINDDINGLMAIWGLDQPIETLWELTPFSFILDWFFTIGDTIAAWAPQAGMTPLASWCVLTRERSKIASFGPLSWSKKADGWPTDAFLTKTPVYRDSIEPLYESVITQQQRVVNPPRTLLPSLVVNLDWLKVTDLALIGRSVLKA